MPLTCRREKRESILYAEFDRLLHLLITDQWRDGVAGLLRLLEHQLLKEHAVEFRELRKSIFYNVALIYKEKGEHQPAFYFFLQCYKLNPENISIIVEMAVICKKEYMVKESLYFFELAFGKDSSPSMRLIYLEQIALLNFFLGNHDVCLAKIDALIRVGFKVDDLSQLREFIQGRLEGSSSKKHDIFSPEFQPEDEDSDLSAREAAAHYPQSGFLQKVLNIRSEFLRRRDESLNCNSEREQEEAQAKPVCITLLRPKWRDLLSVLVGILKLQGLKARHASAAELKSKSEAIVTLKLLSSTDFDLFEDKFKVVLEESEFSRATPDTIEPLSKILSKRHEDGSKERPREERYSGGQMSLREKKNVSKQAESQENYSKGFDEFFQGFLKKLFDQAAEKAFILNELRAIFDAQNSQNLEVASPDAEHRPGDPGPKQETYRLLRERRDACREERVLRLHGKRGRADRTERPHEIRRVRPREQGAQLPRPGAGSVPPLLRPPQKRDQQKRHQLRSGRARRPFSAALLRRVPPPHPASKSSTSSCRSTCDSRGSSPAASAWRHSSRSSSSSARK